MTASRFGPTSFGTRSSVLIRAATTRAATTRAATTRAATTRAVAVPAVASLALRTLITGPPRPVRELARFSQVLYLVVADRPTVGPPIAPPGTDAGADPATGRRAPVIALLPPDAVAVPGGLQLTTELHGWPVAPAAGMVGHGRLVIDGSVVVVHRWWDPVPQLGRTSPRQLLERAGQVARRVRAAPGQAPEPGLLSAFDRVIVSLARGDDAGAARAADAMIGLGPGLTPSGDDLLAALLASIPPLQAAVTPGVGIEHIATDHDLVRAARRLAATVARRAEGRTTTISAELLRHAATGAVARPVLELLRALSGHGAIEPAATRLLRVGSSSGRDLTVGILAAVGLLTGDDVSDPTTRTFPRGA